MIESDHRPAIIKIKRTTEKGFKMFQFDTRLCKIPEFEDVIKQSWNRFGEIEDMTVQERIICCRREISAWKCNNNTNSALRIKELSTTIDAAHSDQTSTLQQIHGLRRELIQAYRDEESFWKIKSRNMWLNEGDGNT